MQFLPRPKHYHILGYGCVNGEIGSYFPPVLKLRIARTKISPMTFSWNCYLWLCLVDIGLDFCNPRAQAVVIKVRQKGYVVQQMSPSQVLALYRCTDGEFVTQRKYLLTHIGNPKKVRFWVKTSTFEKRLKAQFDGCLMNYTTVSVVVNTSSITL